MANQRSLFPKPIRRVRRLGYRPFVVCAVLVGLAGCGGTASDSGAGRESAGGDRNLITRADLEGMDDLNAYEAIRRLKPIWLRYRGQSSLTAAGRESLRVYLNRTAFGNAEALSTLMVRDIREMRFLDARQATLRFGTDHTAGAIVVITGG